MWIGQPQVHFKDIFPCMLKWISFKDYCLVVQMIIGVSIVIATIGEGSYDRHSGIHADNAKGTGSMTPKWEV